VSLRGILQSIYDQHGELTPELVVQEAQAEGHPLHSRFEWDDESAGDSWRRHQASELIRSVKVVYREATEKEEARTVRAFHAVRGPRGHAYQPAEKVAEDPLMKRIVLADMEREWRALKRKYERFAEFADMVRNDLEEAA
jgi:hypothetical protein